MKIQINIELSINYKQTRCVCETLFPTGSSMVKGPWSRSHEGQHKSQNARPKVYTPNINTVTFSAFRHVSMSVV